MTPKEKAKELVQNYLYKVIEFAYAETDYKQLAKQCALIAVDEILKANPIIETRVIKNGCSWIESKTNINYWFEVKQAIKEL